MAPSPPRTRSRSRSPAPAASTGSNARTRSRSRSPRRKPKASSGFRWKEKPRKDEAADQSRSHDRHDRHDRDNRAPRGDRRRDEEPAAKASADRGAAEAAPKEKKDKKDKKDKKPKAPPQSNEPMIIVNVNDRLGTKAAIPCLASDSIRLFKAQVAARIGRQPHEIMLKRQGERPMKDILTLADYGVSNGVQLDLELDTGD